MLYRKQKQQAAKRPSHIDSNAVSQLVAQYRSLIIPTQFNLKQIETFGSILPIELQSVQNNIVDEDTLRELVIDVLKLSFIYDPLIQTLKTLTQSSRSYFPLKLILRVLLKGQFYRFIHNSQNELKMLINNRTTQANVEIIISGLLIFVLKRLTLQQISMALLFFTLEASLNSTEHLAISLEQQKLIFRKIERIVKPIQLKIWLQALKNSKQYKGHIYAHHFLYLCGLSEKKHGINTVDFRPKLNSLFRNFNANIKSIEVQDRQVVKEIKQERRIVRGLSFVDVRPKQVSFSKSILRQFRLRDPSKFKRPNTAFLKRHVSEFLNNDKTELKIGTQKQNKFFRQSNKMRYTINVASMQKPSANKFFKKNVKQVSNHFLKLRQKTRVQR